MNKKIILVLFIILLISSLTYGDDYLKDIEVTDQNTGIIINGNELEDEESFIYNGNLYGPLRNVVELMGGEIIWDGENNKALISSFTNVKECDYLNGEKFVYGLIIDIDYDKKNITIEQHYDDNSIMVTPKLEVRDDVNIVLFRNDKGMNLDFKDLIIGEDVGIVLDNENLIRGILIRK